MIKSVINFILSLQLLIGVTFFTIIPVFGISYYGAEDSPIMMMSMVFVALVTMAYIFFYETRHHRMAHGSMKPYLIPIAISLAYFFDTTCYMDMSRQSFRIFTLFICNTIPSLMIACYSYRYDKLQDIIKNVYPIAVLSSVGLILSVPTMYLAVDYDTSIGGGGGHQAISYCSAIFACYFLIDALHSEEGVRYKILDKKIFRIVDYVFVLTNVVICFIGGGRGGAVLLILNLFLTFFLMYRRSFGKLFIRSIIAVFVLYLVSIITSSDNVLYEQISKGLERAFSFISPTGSIDMSQTSERDVVYNATIKLIQDVPFYGYGIFHQYEVCLAKISQLYCHNIFLEVILQGGYLLILPFCIIYIKFMGKIWQFLNTSNLNIYLLPIISFPIVQLMFSDTYIKSSLFWFVLIYIMNYDRNYNKIKNFDTI